MLSTMSSVLVVDPAISVLNKHLTVPAEDVLSQDSVERCFEIILKTALLVLPYNQPLQPFPFVRLLLTGLDNPVFEDPVLLEQLQFMPLALLFCVDALENVIRQVSSMTLLPEHIHRILWIKAWSARLACKISLIRMPFNGECLFGESPGVDLGHSTCKSISSPRLLL